MLVRRHCRCHCRCHRPVPRMCSCCRTGRSFHRSCGGGSRHGESGARDTGRLVVSTQARGWPARLGGVFFASTLGWRYGTPRMSVLFVLILQSKRHPGGKVFFSSTLHVSMPPVSSRGREVEGCRGLTSSSLVLGAGGKRLQPSVLRSLSHKIQFQKKSWFSPADWDAQRKVKTKRARPWQRVPLVNWSNATDSRERGG